MTTVYEACGYKVVDAPRDAYGPRYDVLDPKGKRITTVSSVQGYKRVIRKAAGINACRCGCLPGAHYAPIAPSTDRVPRDERTLRLWQFIGSRQIRCRDASNPDGFYQRYNKLRARLMRERFVDKHWPGAPGGCCKHKGTCSLTPSQVAADVRRREREMSR